MKRFLLLFALLGAFFAAASCSPKADTVVEARADLYFADGTLQSAGPVSYDGFRSRYFSDSDLESIFKRLTGRMDLSGFTSGLLHLTVRDAVTGAPLREESYGVVYGSHTGHFDFADIDLLY